MIIVVYVMDSLRPDYLGCYGYGKSTSPNIDNFAKDSALFTKAYSTASWTKPAAASLFTGQYPRSIHMNQIFNVLPDNVTTLPELLTLKDFKCIGINANGFVSSSFGFGKGFSRYVECYKKYDLIKGGRHYVDIQHDEISPVEGVKKFVIAHSEDLNKEVGVRNLKSSDSTFLLFWSVDTHDPFFVRGGKSYFKNRRDMYIHAKELRKYSRDKGIKILKSLYCDMIHYNDFHFENLLQQLRLQNLYDDSMIVLLSDHGQGFMEHGFNSHGGIVFEEQIRIPLIIKFPENRYAGKIIDTPVQITDIMPTILHTAGIEYNGPMDGMSLHDSIHKPPESRIIFCENQMKANSIWSESIRIGRWKYLRVAYGEKSGFHINPRGVKRWISETISAFKDQLKGVRFYDLKNDSAEQRPVKFSGSDNLPDFSNILDNLLKELERRGDKTKKEVLKKQAIDNKLNEHLRGLGYID